MKACLVGEAAVGKTSLIRRFVLDQFSDAYAQTLGSKVSKRELTATHGGETFAVGMTIWDIMGQKGFRELLQDAYFKDAHGVLAVADGTRKDTLPGLREWIDGVHEIAGEVPIVLLANKADLREATVLTEAAVAWAAGQYQAPYFFTSAKSGDNVREAFQSLADRVAGMRMGASVP